MRKNNLISKRVFSIILKSSCTERYARGYESRRLVTAYYSIFTKQSPLISGGIGSSMSFSMVGAMSASLAVSAVSSRKLQGEALM